jgi:hypothetical protein
MIKGLFLGLSCFLLFLSHIFILHKFNIRRKFFAIAVSSSCGLFLYSVCFLATPKSFFYGVIPVILLAFLNGAFLHFFLGYFYLHLIQLIDRSLSTRMMVEIEKSPSHKLSAQELKQAYSIDEKISYELEDMVVLGRLVKENGAYKLTPKGKFHSGVFKMIRNYLKLKRN